MRLRIEGHHLPGRNCGKHQDVHVALQLGTDPVGAVPGDAPSARWEVDVRAVAGPHGRDFKGPAVHGRMGERFVYLTWGSLTDGEFAMFRRAKLMLADAPYAEDVTVAVHLTDDCGMPRCARLAADAVTWTSGSP